MIKPLRLLLHICTLLLTAALPGHAQTFLWAERGGGTSTEEAGGLATDRDGNTYVTGFFTTSATFSGTTVNSAGREDAYLAKYSTTGRLVWIRTIGSTGFDRGFALALDTAGAHIYITGAFEGTITVGNSVSSQGLQDVFVAKYDSAGTALWARSGGSSTFPVDQGRGVSTDNAGNVYVTGGFSGTATFSGQTLTSIAGTEDIFIAKYSPTGTLLWLRQLGGSDTDRGLAIRSDSAGNSYITGLFRGSVTFGSQTFTATGNDVFIAKYSTNGTLLWARQGGGSGNDTGFGVETDRFSNVYVGGSFSGTATFGTTSLSSSGSLDVFLAKYDSTGTLLWANRGGGTGEDEAFGLYVSSSGIAYLTGYFNGTATFGPTSSSGTLSVSSAGVRDIFVARYSPGGTLLDLLRAGGADRDDAIDIAVDAAGNSYLHGTFSGTTTLGSFSFASGGITDVFTAKLSPFTTPLPVVLTAFTLTSETERVLAQWETATEKDNDYFVLERSADGTEFTGVATVKGAGNSSSPRTYHATDQAPLPGTSYYRLRQVDNDGKTTLSQVVAVTRQQQVHIAVFPNPSAGAFSIRSTTPGTGTVHLLVTDLSGRVVHRASVTATNRGFEHSLDLGTYAPGVYLLQIQGGSATGFRHLVLTR